MGNPATYKFTCDQDMTIQFKPSANESIGFSADARIDAGVPYEGATEVTPTESTQTLLTEGKTLDSNIIVNPIPEQFKDITVVTAEPQDVAMGKIFVASDGLTKEGTYEYIYNFMGEDVEVVYADVWTRDIQLKDTNFATWTPSTTAKALWTASNIKTFAVDMEQYEYIVEWMWDVPIHYMAGRPNKAQPSHQGGVMYQVLSRRPNSVANIYAENFNGNYCTTYYTGSSFIEYLNASGTDTFAVSSSYGIYGAVTAHTFSSATSNTPNVTLKTPVMNARCSNTYMSTTAASYIDQVDTRIKMTGNVYRVKRESSAMTNMFRKAIEVFNQGI